MDITYLQKIDVKIEKAMNELHIAPDKRFRLKLFVRNHARDYEELGLPPLSYEEIKSSVKRHALS